jgi:formate transporter
LFVKTSTAVITASSFTAEQLSTLNIKTFLIDNLIPVTAGNIVGALLFVVGTFWLAYMKRK